MKRIICLLTLVGLVACLKPRGSRVGSTDTPPETPQEELLTQPEPEEKAMFEREFAQTKLLPLGIRALKLEQWLPTPELAGQARTQIEANFEELGGHNFAGGRPEATALSKQLLEKWLLNIEPFCSNPQTQQHFATSGIRGLFTSVYGRAPEADDLLDLTAFESEASLSASEKFTVACMAFLSSLEFISY